MTHGMLPPTTIFATPSLERNILRALAYWRKHRNMDLFQGSRGGVAVTRVAHAPMFRAAHWHQTDAEALANIVQP